MFKTSLCFPNKYYRIIIQDHGADVSVCIAYFEREQLSDTRISVIPNIFISTCVVYLVIYKAGHAHCG